MRTRLTPAALAIVLGIGCGLLRPPPLPEDTSDPVRLLAQADELAENRAPRSAQRIYREVLRKHAKTPAAADALYGLGQLYVDPQSPLRDYSAAHTAFGRLLAEHPDSPRAPSARAWHTALGELLQSQTEVTKLRSDIEELKRLDLEQERTR